MALNASCAFSPWVDLFNLACRSAATGMHSQSIHAANSYFCILCRSHSRIQMVDAIKVQVFAVFCAKFYLEPLSASFESILSLSPYWTQFINPFPTCRQDIFENCLVRRSRPEARTHPGWRR